jgi:hypothetical protein
MGKDGENTFLGHGVNLGLPSGLFSLGLTTKSLYAALLSLLRSTCPAHFMLLDLITRIIFEEEYRS